MLLTFLDLSFTHENAVNPLFSGVNISFPTGWTGIVGANGAGKTTLLRLACGELEPEKGRVHRPGLVIYCPQRTDFPPDGFPEFIESDDQSACQLRGRMGIETDWLSRWESLSHGERKRAQIALALWREPDVLAVDEPTNHIDFEARNLLAEALKSFKGIGLLVSHDRELLDSLCRQCAFIDSPNVTMRPGNYTESFEQARIEDDHVREEYDKVKASAQRLKQQADRLQAEVSRADRKRSKRGLNPRDHDAKGKIDLARLSGADGRIGQIAAQMGARADRAKTSLGEFDIKRRYDISFWLSSSRSEKKMLFDIPAGSLSLGPERKLVFPELYMAPTDRIAITGVNGSGKSTLIRHIVERLKVPEEKVIYLPQEIDEETSRKLMQEVNSLSKQELGQVMTIVSCLGSRPERLVSNNEVSPGEIRKVLLALGISRAPHLIIMDEPTNHLDLPATESLENALADCPCGLLLVSHDFRFLSRLAAIRWRLESEGPDSDVQLRIMSADTLQEALA